jgi:H+/Cl- antiporter ClcA
MNIAKNKPATKNIFSLLKKNQLKFLLTVAFMFIITFVIAFIVIFYCDIFYKFSDLAKERIKNNPQITFIITPLLFWLSAFLYKKYASNPSGTGLDNATFALKKLEKYPNQYKKISNLIGFKIALIIFSSSLISTYSGGSLGREAPSIMIAVSIIVGASYYLRKFLLKIALEIWIYVGYAIGLFIAFNAPIAGMIYITEKMIKNKSKNYSKILLLSVLAILILIFLPSSQSAIYPVFNIEKIDFKYFKYFIFLIIICTILSFLLLNICRFYYKKIIIIKSYKWHFIPIILGIIVAIIGIYSGVYAIGGGINSTNQVLSSNQVIFGYKEFFGRYFSTIFTYITASAGGLVAPSIAMGAVLGSIYGSFFENVPLLIFVLVGMVAFLTPVLNVSMAPAMVIVESTKIDYSNFVVLIVVSLMSFFLNVFFQKIYSKIRVKLFKPRSN